MLQYHNLPSLPADVVSLLIGKIDVSTDFEVYPTFSDFRDDVKASEVISLLNVFEVSLVVGFCVVSNFSVVPSFSVDALNVVSVIVSTTSGSLVASLVVDVSCSKFFSKLQKKFRDV